MIALPYIAGKQELGETRQAMTKTLMRDIEKIIDELKSRDEKYYILVHAKPYPDDNRKIKIKIVKGIPVKPHMMLSCVLFGVDNKTGTLTLEWSLPGDWPTWSVGGTQEPVPEVIASINESKIRYYYDEIAS